MWANEEFLSAEIEAAKSDWRPLVSYTANLRRIGERLLGTNAAWERLGQLSPAGQRSHILLQMMGNQYPWYWSAAVLVGIIRDFRYAFSISPSSRWIGSSDADRRLPRRFEVVRQRHRRQQADARNRPGRHRAARTERRRQVDAAAVGHGPAAAEPGHSPRARAGGVEQCVAQSLDRLVPGAGCVLRVDDGLGFCIHLRTAERLATCSSPRRPPSGRSRRSA